MSPKTIGSGLTESRLTLLIEAKGIKLILEDSKVDS